VVDPSACQHFGEGQDNDNCRFDEDEYPKHNPILPCRDLQYAPIIAQIASINPAGSAKS
jgi:hypothetical protein